jgi:hypothetical protein
MAPFVATANNRLCEDQEVDLREYFLEIGNKYDRLAGLDTPTQTMLTTAQFHLAEHAPPGVKIVGSGGKGMATYTPWVGFFNPDETDTPQRGIYVVYLFSEDLQHLVLTLNQGMEYLRSDLGDKAARQSLAADAEAIRSALDEAGQVDPRWSREMDLRSKGARQKAYNAGDIASITYEMRSMPAEEQLRTDLTEVLAIYEEAIRVKRTLLLEKPGIISTPSAPQTKGVDAANPLAGFKPKSANDYRAALSGREITKSRRHEQIVVDFSTHCTSLGFKTTSPHPCDLVVHTQDLVHLVEVKVVYGHNVTNAVRDSVGQLFAYSYFLFPTSKPELIAVFSEPIGAAYEEFLLELGITPIWWESGTWLSAVPNEFCGL